MPRGETRIDPKSLPILLYGTLGISLSDQVLGKELVHPGGIGGDQGKVVAGLFRQVRVDSVDNIENVHVRRVQLLKHAQNRRSLLQILLLIIEFGQSHPGANLQFRILQMRKRLFQERFRGVDSSLGLFA
ncbi:MAG: hypothetical protein ABR920_01955 [Terriglobales bacterium]